MWILLFSAHLWAADAISTAIDQAQALVVKKNRSEAAKVLNAAIDKAAPPLKGRARLIDAENNLAKIFLTDKGQKTYESAQSVLFDNPDLALSQLREAQGLEDENVLVLESIARLQISKQDCLGAEQTLKKARQLYPYAQEPAVLELRTLICQNNFEAFREKTKALPALEKSQDLYVRYMVAQDFLQQKMWRKAIEILSKLAEDDPRFPETYFLLSRAEQELDKDNETSTQKYISLCKAAGPRERKKYFLEPRLCASAKELQDELPKKTSDL